MTVMEWTKLLWKTPEAEAHPELKAWGERKACAAEDLKQATAELKQAIKESRPQRLHRVK